MITLLGKLWKGNDHQKGCPEELQSKQLSYTARKCQPTEVTRDGQGSGIEESG